MVSLWLCIASRHKYDGLFVTLLNSNFIDAEICTFLPYSIFCLSSVTSWQGCEKEVTEASDGASDEQKGESIMRLSWALVHSRRPDDVQRGIAMLEGVAN